MKLIFLYTKIGRNQSESEINLDSNIRFSFDGDCLRVSNKEVIPNAFFSTRENRSSVVESVSAIVGENGSGKTSIARYIAEIIAGKTANRKFIAIFKIDRQYIAAYNNTYFDERIFGQVEEILPKSCRYTKAQFEASFIYVSPHFSIEPVIADDGKRVFDYSTTGLMNIRKFRGRSSWGVSNYKASEYLRALSVIAAYVRRYDAPSEPGEILRRSGVQIKLKRHAMTMQTYSVAGLRRDERESPIFKRLREVYDFVSGGRDRSTNIITKVMRACVLCQIKERLPIESSKQEDEIYGLISVFEMLADDRWIEESYKNGYEILDAINRAFRNGYFNIVNGVNKLLDGLTTLTRASGVEIKKDTIVIHAGLAYEEIIVPLTKLVEGYSECVGEEDFLQFSFTPALSSGEMAFLGLWGRLYQFFKPKEDAPTSHRNAIVYLDESETALHPEWQRKLVWYTIWFIENLTKDANVHFIFATHSPILLSDIPINNVHFLKGARDRKFLQKEELARMHNTFAANIFDLYRLSFFMQEGTIGKFAYEKVNDLIKRTSFADKDSIEALVNLVGDKMIRRYLSQEYGVEETKRD